MKNTNLKKLCVSAILIAAATALSFVKIIKLPWGGSITLLSMLPIALISIIYGIKQGLFSSFVYACIQLVMGITMDGLLGWGLSGGMLVACILLDYIVPFTIIGLSGIFKSKGNIGIMSGTVLAIALRYVSHVFSGIYIFASVGKIWEGFSTNNHVVYSLVYNACYMLPEMIFTTIGAFFVYKAVDKVVKNTTK